MVLVDEVPVQAMRPPAEAPLLLTGRDTILSLQPRLQRLADRCGQCGVADTLDYFLTQPYYGGKSPHLLLFQQRPTPGAEPELEGAVLVHQYRVAGVPLRVFVTEDTGGERNVIGPAHARSAIALRSAQYLLRARGAHAVLLSLQGGAFYPAHGASAGGSGRWVSAQRNLLRRMPLLPSYQATLDTLGAHTRRNFRLYRRRAVTAHGCSFAPQADLSEEAFIALNAMCDYPVPARVARWRYRSLHAMPGGVLTGVRTAAGTWISMIGGRRACGTFRVDWQMNNAAFARLSPTTLLRGYLMEHEAELGTRDLMFQGGTPHPMQAAFRPEPVADLVAVTDTLPARLLLRAARAVHEPKNFLLETLQRNDLRWHPQLEA